MALATGIIAALSAASVLVIALPIMGPIARRFSNPPTSQQETVLWACAFAVTTVGAIVCVVRIRGIDHPAAAIVISLACAAVIPLARRPGATTLRFISRLALVALTETLVVPMRPVSSLLIRAARPLFSALEATPLSVTADRQYPLEDSLGHRIRAGAEELDSVSFARDLSGGFRFFHAGSLIPDTSGGRTRPLREGGPVVIAWLRDRQAELARQEDAVVAQQAHVRDSITRQALALAAIRARREVERTLALIAAARADSVRDRRFVRIASLPVHTRPSLEASIIYRLTARDTVYVGGESAMRGRKPGQAVAVLPALVRSNTATVPVPVGTTLRVVATTHAGVAIVSIGDPPSEMVGTLSPVDAIDTLAGPFEEWIHISARPSIKGWVQLRYLSAVSQQMEQP